MKEKQSKSKKIQTQSLKKQIYAGCDYKALHAYCPGSQSFRVLVS